MGFGDRTVKVPLLDEEQIVAEAFGAVGRKTGGKLIVTNFRLLFQPWDLGLANELIKWGCKAFQVPHASVITYVVGKAKAIVDATAQGVGDIVAVESAGSASLFNLPKIRVTKGDGTVAEFGVVASPTTPNASTSNNSARDNLAAVIRQVFL
jgi:hypothetical protein